MKIIIDAHGGDYSPDEIVKGAILATKIDDIEIVLTGNSEIISPMIAGNDKIELISTSEIIGNDESPVSAVRNKKDSSLVVAMEALRKRDDIDAFIGASSTGAILSASLMKVGRIEGVSRPALCPLLPTYGGGRVMLMDCGANMDCKALNILHFAQMSTAYMVAYGVQSPRVALLNVGTEGGKGNELTKEAYYMLKDAKNINFVGNVEAREVLSGNYDIVLSDGFAGNILLKSIEGTASMVTKELKREIKKSTMSKIGALFMNKAFKGLKATFDYNSYGGSPFLGIKKLVIKSHGDSDADAIYQCVLQAKTLHNKDIINCIKDAVNDENI